MKFIDEAIIFVESGHGGPGIKSFRREKYVPYGGPDGGDGGLGGSVILVADRNRSSLLDFHFQPRWKAEDGNAGEGSKREGKSGDDLLIQVPVGTQVYRCAGQNHDKSPILGELVHDLSEEGERFVIAKGGRGGKGNAFFKSATNRAPEHFQPGEAGTSGEFVLSLKVVADVGLIGFPNAGKSTLISRISSARPKIADYPFTTLTPNLGVVRTKGNKTFVVADIPGLIPGAHAGKGLGTKFLKHVERTAVLAHLIDPQQLAEDGTPLPPDQTWEVIMKELRLFSETIAERPQIVVLTKLDAVSDRAALKATMEGFEALGHRTFAISAVSGEGLPELIEALGTLVQEHRNSEALAVRRATPQENVWD